MKTSIHNITSETLFWKFFAGEASLHEKEEILAWVKLSDANKRCFQVSREAFICAKHADTDTVFDYHTAYAQFARKKAPAKKMFSWQSIAVAASIVLLVGFGLSIVLPYTTSSQPAPLLYASSAIETKAVALPDSSEVLLHSGATLVYALQESGVRSVQLDGEAFFDIVHDAEHPFEVVTGDLTIRVLGTSFIVDTQTDSSKVSVKVLSGRVMVSAGKDSHILNANEGTVYDNQSKLFGSQQPFDKNSIAWKTDQLEFNATPLSEVASVLGKYFGRTIIVPDSVIAQYPLSVEFTQPKLESVLTLLELTFGIDVVQTDSLIILSRVTVMSN